MKSPSKIARRYYLKHVLIYVLVELMLFYAPLPVLLANPNPSATALPYGHDSPSGVSFTPASSSLTMGNVSNGTVINWKNFDIGAASTVTFNQTSASAYVLNRVSATDGMATGIMGTLIANGGVIVINPRGIVIGPDALINAGKFVASGLGISDKDFRDFASGAISVLKFDAGWSSGNVTNSGTINATEAVYLVGKNVTNTGTISCPGGMIVMAAGEKVYLAQSGSNVVVEKLDTGSNPGDNVVRNESTIDADGAGILLAAGDIYSQATIENARSFVATADRNLNVDGSLENVTGNINLYSKQNLTIDSSMEVGGNLNLSANQNLNINGELTVEGDALLYADFDHVDGGDFHSTAPIAASGNIEVRGNDVLFDETVDAGGDLTIVGRDCHPPEWQWGNVTAMKTLHADGDISISVTGEQKEWVDGHWEGRTWVDGYWKEGQCGHKEWVCGHWEGGWYVPGYWDITYAPGTIYLHDNVTAGKSIMLCNNTETYNDTDNGVRLQAGKNVILAEDGIANSQRDNCTYLHGRNNLEIVALDGVITNDSSLFDNLDNPEITLSTATDGAALTTISVDGSTLLMEQTPSIDTKDFTFDNQGDTHLTLISDEGSVTSDMAKPENAADKWNSIGATAYEDITLSGSGSIRSGDSGTDTSKSLWAGKGQKPEDKIGDIEVTTGQSFSADKDIEAGSDVTVMASDNILLMGDATAGQNITLTATEDVEAQGDLTAGGNIEVYAPSDDTIYLGGDVDAGGNVLLNNNTRFVGWFDQLVQAGGTITANGWLNKINYNHCLGWSDGSLYLHASGDIILGDSVGDDYVKAACFKYDCYGVGGGVSIISDTGSIYTQEADGMLNVPITGRSDHFAYIGVGLPYAPGLAAIVIKSNKDLMLGPSAELTAGGRYYEPEIIDETTWSIDDRPGVGFLAEPATIGGYLRDEGDPFDLAIYVASKNGNVDVSGPVTIESRSEPVYAVGEQSLSSIPECPGCEPKGAMVVDAHDSVTFGPDFLSSLGNGDVGDRLEVCSRITEWLEDAITFERLPYADAAAAMSMLWYGNPDSYVLRGAGAENPDIGEGAPAWVLESKEKPIPIPIEPFAPAAPIQQPELKFTGCPALMNWVARELGLEADQLQIYMDSTLAMSSGIQPCDTCARLKNTALVLMDADGAQLKALGQVVNEFAAGGAPPSEEQMAIIATALQNPKEGTQYALAAQWLDALTEYVTILNKDLQLPTDESTALAAKYTAPVTGGDNAALAAYVQARLATIGG